MTSSIGGWRMARARVQSLTSPLDPQSSDERHRAVLAWLYVPHRLERDAHARPRARRERDIDDGSGVRVRARLDNGGSLFDERAG